MLFEKSSDRWRGNASCLCCVSLRYGEDLAAAAQYVTLGSGCLAPMENNAAFVRACETLHARYWDDRSAYDRIR